MWLLLNVVRTDVVMLNVVAPSNLPLLIFGLMKNNDDHFKFVLDVRNKFFCNLFVSLNKLERFSPINNSARA